MTNWGILGTGMIAKALAVSMEESLDSHLKAVASRSIEKAKKFGDRYHCFAIEGYENLDWVLLDYVNIVVHIFSQNSRKFYDLERLWADGNILTIQDNNIENKIN